MRLDPDTRASGERSADQDLPAPSSSHIHNDASSSRRECLDVVMDDPSFATRELGELSKSGSSCLPRVSIGHTLCLTVEPSLFHANQLGRVTHLVQVFFITCRGYMLESDHGSGSSVSSIYC